jgi:integrase
VWAPARVAGPASTPPSTSPPRSPACALGELIALRWRDLDFAGSTVRVRASFDNGDLTTPEAGQGPARCRWRPDVATALAQLGRRTDWVGDDDLVFPRAAGDHLDASALRRRHKSALAAVGLRPLRFHDLRHTFGTRMTAKADIRRVQEWIAHADIQTTMRYLHFAPRAEDAALVADTCPRIRDRDHSKATATERSLVTTGVSRCPGRLRTSSA